MRTQVLQEVAREQIAFDLGTGVANVTRDLAAPSPPLIGNDEFVAALKGALRDFNRPDLLTRNPLLNARILAGNDAAGPAELRALLSDTVGTLFASARDEKLRRALELTYFQTAPKQEIVADRLGLAFGTYRRHLTAAHKRLADWLWHKEMAARDVKPAVASSPKRGGNNGGGRAGHDKPEIHGGAHAPPLHAVDTSREQRKLAATTAPQVPLLLPDKPSIAVLPFQNMSGDPEQEYFADGVVEDIITALSRSKSLFVIARNSSFTYKGRAVDIKQVGHELGVRYVLEGSVRRTANRVRITGQLVDVASGSHVWADRYEDDLADIFGLQDRVTSSVVGAIFPNLELAEITRARQKVGNLEAYDYYLQSLAAFFRFTRNDHEQALSLVQKAIDLDPEFALAYAMKSHWHCGVRKSSGWDDNPVQEREEAERLARRAMELDRNDPRVLAYVGITLAWGLLRCQEGSDLIDQALEIDPNYALAWSWGAFARVGLGDHDGAIKYCERALRLSPLDPRAFIAASAMASVHFLAGRYEEAASWAAKALRQHHGYPLAMQITVASHALAGRFEDAKRACALYLQLHPKTRLSGIKDRMLCVREEDIQKYVTGLRLAGLPE